MRRGAGVARPSPVRFVLSSSAVERVGLCRHPLAAGDLVDRQHLVGGVAVLVKGDVTGDAGEVGGPDSVHDRLTDGGVDRLLARQYLRQRVDDHVRRVVGVRAVRRERLGVAGGRVRRDEVLRRCERVSRRADRGREVAVGLGTSELDVGVVVDAVAAHQRDVQTGSLHLLRQRAGLRVLAAVVDGLRTGWLDLADDAREVLVTRVDLLVRGDGATVLLPLLLELVDEAGAIGLLVVDRRDLLDALRLEVLGRERTLDCVRRSNAEVGLVRPRLVALREVRSLGQGRVRVGRRDHDDVLVVVGLLLLLRHAGVQGADDADEVALAGEAGRDLATDVGVGLVILRVELDGPAGDLLVLVRLLYGEVDGVLHAESECGQRAGERGGHADDDGFAATAASGAAAAVTPTTRDGDHAERRRNGDACDETVTHDLLPPLLETRPDTPTKAGTSPCRARAT